MQHEIVQKEKDSDIFRKKLGISWENVNRKPISSLLPIDQLNKKPTIDINRISYIEELFDNEVSSDSDYRLTSGESSEDSDDENEGEGEIRINNMEISTQPTLHIRIGDDIHKILLDSGADVSVASLQLVKSLEKKSQLISWNKKPSINRTVRGADGSVMDTSGKATLQLLIGDHVLEFEFLVVNSLTQSCIIGRDFLAKYGVAMDWLSCSIRINDRLFPIGNKKQTLRDWELFTLEDFNKDNEFIDPVSDMNRKLTSAEPRTLIKNENKYIATLKRTTELLPGENKNLRCIASSNTPTEMHYMTVPVQKPFCLHPEIAICYGIVYIGKTLQHIQQVSNLSGRQIKLPEGMLIANLTPKIKKEESLNEKDSNVAQTNSTCSAKKNMNALETMSHQEIMTMQWEGEKTPLVWPPEPNIPIPMKYAKEIKELVEKYEECFTDTDEQLTRANCEEYTIELTDKTPVFERALPCPLPMREKLRAHIHSMLIAGTIKPSLSQYASQAFLVMKNHGKSSRFVVNYKKLNEKIKSVRYPLPRIEELMSIVAGKKYYSNLDARSSFHQIPISKESQPITAFTCVVGQYEYTVTPQGLKISPGIFQSFSDKLFVGMNDFVLPYMDDYIVFSMKCPDHVKDLARTMKRIKLANIKLKRSKCKFAERSMKFLGFVLSSYGLALDEDKVIAITKMTPPKTVRGVRSILGSSGFYRRHVLNYSKLCEPLTELTKDSKDNCLKKIVWTPECDQAFEILKKALVNAPILHNPELNGDFRLYCDASITTIGSILTQVTADGHEKVCLYLSHKLPPDKLKLSIQAKEALAIYYSFKKLYHWIAGAHVDVFTDCKTLLGLFKASFTNSCVDRMGIYLSTFDARLIHLKGTKNLFADMLSRPNELDVPDNGNYSDPRIPKFFKMPVRNNQGQNMGNTYVIKHRRAGLWMKGSAVYPKKENYTVMEAPWQVNSINCSDIFIKVVLEEQKKTFATTRQFNNSLYSQFKHSAYNEVKEKSKENLKRKNIWLEATDDKAKCIKREVHNHEPPNLQAVTIKAITEEEKQKKRMRKLDRNLEIDMDDSGKINAGRTRRRHSKNEDERKINQHNDYSTQLETDKSNTTNDTRAKGKQHPTLNARDDNESHNVTDIITDLKDTSETNNSLENNSEDKNPQQNMPNNTTGSENVETRKEDQYIEVNKNPKQQAEDNTLLLKDLSPELVKNLQKECDFYKDIIEALQQGLSSKEFIMIEGLLHYIDQGTKRSEPLVRACIPRVLVGGLLDSYHNWFSHPSADKTYYSIRKKYYWPNMYSDCHHYTQKCRKCRAVNAKQTIAPLGRPEIPTEAGLDLSIDFVGPLIISLKGNKYIFTILDKFSNYLHAHPIPEKSSNMAVSYILDQYIPTQGCPKTISSDNDPAFASDAMLAIYSSFGIKHVTTSSYNPRANKVERSHRFLSEYFKKTMEDDYQCWDEALPRIVMTYNCTPGKSGLSPMEVHMGRQPNIPFDFLFGTQPKYMGECDVKRKLQDTHVRFAKARKELLRTQEYNAQYQKRKVNRPDFQLFDKVMIKDYIQKPSGTKKLRPRYMADFKIVKQLAQDTFVVENVKNGRRYRRHANDIIKDNNESAWHRKFDDFTPRPYKKCRPKYYDEDPIIPKIKTPIRDRLPRSAKNAFDTYMTSSEESGEELEENTGTHFKGNKKRDILDAVRFKNSYTTRNVGNDDTQMDQQHTQPTGPLQQNDHENRYHRSQSYDAENNDIPETMDYKQISPSHIRENIKKGLNESDYRERMTGTSRKRAIQAEINEAKFQKLDNDMIPMDNEEMDASDSELSWDDTSHSYVYNNYRIKRNSGKSQKTCI